MSAFGSGRYATGRRSARRLWKDAVRSSAITRQVGRAKRIRVIRLPDRIALRADADRHGHLELVDCGAVVLVVDPHPAGDTGQEASLSVPPPR